MYNHYIPQSDGSYRRNQVPEPPRRQQPPRQNQSQQQSRQQPQNHPAPPPPSKQEQKPCSPAQPEPKPCPQKPPEQQPVPRCETCTSPRQEQGILGFLRNLLPRDVDTSDFIIIALLLLLCNDEKGEDGDLAPLLTIALYFLL